MIKRICLTLLLCVLAISGARPARAGDKLVSDDLIYDRVKQKLATDPVVKGGALEIDVKAGVVLLKGSVDSEKRKAKAEKVAHKISGVKSVDNQIQVVQK